MATGKRPSTRAEAIVRAMDGAGIGKSVVFAMATTTERSTQMVRDAIRQFPDRLVPYAYALPRYDRAVLPELEQALAEFGCKGIKLHLGECTVESYVADSVFDLAARYQAPCLIDFGGRLELCASVVAAYPQTTIIICHLGRYLSTDEAQTDAFIRVAEEHPNALLDASGVVLLGKIEEAAQRVGAERILWRRWAAQPPGRADLAAPPTPSRLRARRWPTLCHCASVRRKRTPSWAGISPACSTSERPWPSHLDAVAEIKAHARTYPLAVRHGVTRRWKVATFSAIMFGFSWRKCPTQIMSCGRKVWAANCQPSSMGLLPAAKTL